MEHTVYTCDPDGSLSSSVSPCYDVNGVHSAPSLVSGYLLTPVQGSSFEVMDQPFDYATASGFWMLSFTSVILLWAVSKSAGTVLNFIRRG
jgi:flavin reductase (DIM6/NTAB) family NADH-FMN oxidoreductase RutF